MPAMASPHHPLAAPRVPVVELLVIAPVESVEDVSPE
jgi:hypothetical protein